MDKDTKQKLLKRAKAKYVTNGLANALRKLDSPLQKAYINTYFCNRTMVEHQGKLTTSYCKNRWCLVCNRNRIGKLINEYLPDLEKRKNMYFVTLTCRTVPANKLKKRIDDMLNEWNKIRLYSFKFKEKIKLNGIRKLECTARPGNMYHPHFHLIIEGRKQAEWVRDQWLKRWPQESERAAQDIRKANKDSVKELFKYFTKLITKTEPANLFERKNKTVIVHPEKLDIIFQAMKNRRVYQSFGNVKKINEDVEEKSKIAAPYAGAIFKWVNSDWFDTQTGEALTGWVPNKDIEELVSSISSPPTEDEEFDEEPVSSISSPPPEIKIKPPDELSEVF